jgi:hypothetical protein
MTKNTTREVHDKHTQEIRNGTLPFWKEDVKQDSSVTEFTMSQSLAASTVTTSPGDSSVSTGSVKSRMSKQPLEKRAGGRPPVYSCKIQCKVKLHAGCMGHMEQDPNGRKHCISQTCIR